MKITTVEKASVKLVGELEGILEEFEEDIPFRKDIILLHDIIEEVRAHPSEEVGRFARRVDEKKRNSRLKKYELRSYVLTPEQGVLLDRIKNHATYFKEKGQVGYKINDDFYDTEEMKQLLASYLDNEFMYAATYKIFRDAMGICNESKHKMSSRRVMYCEIVINSMEQDKKDKENGGIFPPMYVDFEAAKTCYRIISFGLDRKKLDELPVKTDKVLEFMQQYDTPEKLDELKATILHRVRESSYAKYEEAFANLVSFFESIDLEKHILTDIRCARPKYDS